MGLATIDPHSHKVQIKLYKTPKFGVNRPKSKQDTAILKCQNLQRNVWQSGKSRDYHDVIVFEKLRFQRVFLQR